LDFFFSVSRPGTPNKKINEFLVLSLPRKIDEARERQ
jgi:hypothetical protein